MEFEFFTENLEFLQLQLLSTMAVPFIIHFYNIIKPQNS